MDKITQKQIDDAIRKCSWRQDFMGIPICSGDCAPCQHLIEKGECDTLKRLFSEAKSENKK